MKIKRKWHKIKIDIPKAEIKNWVGRHGFKDKYHPQLDAPDSVEIDNIHPGLTDADRPWRSVKIGYIKYPRVNWNLIYLKKNQKNVLKSQSLLEISVA